MPRVLISSSWIYLHRSTRNSTKAIAPKFHHSHCQINFSCNSISLLVTGNKILFDSSSPQKGSQTQQTAQMRILAFHCQQQSTGYQNNPHSRLHLDPSGGNLLLLTSAGAKIKHNRHQPTSKLEILPMQNGHPFQT